MRGTKKGNKLMVNRYAAEIDSILQGVHVFRVVDFGFDQLVIKFPDTILEAPPFHHAPSRV
jgi:hypothetical protein